MHFEHVQTDKFDLIHKIQNTIITISSVNKLSRLNKCALNVLISFICAESTMFFIFSFRHSCTIIFIVSFKKIKNVIEHNLHVTCTCRLCVHMCSHVDMCSSSISNIIAEIITKHFQTK